MVGLASAGLPGERVKQVKEPDIDVLCFSGPMVSQDVIDLLERRGNEAAGMTIVDGRELPGMGVVKGKAAVGWKRLRKRGGGKPGYERQGQGGGAQTDEPAATQGLRDPHFRFILVHRLFQATGNIIPNQAQYTNETGLAGSRSGRRGKQGIGSAP